MDFLWVVCLFFTSCQLCSSIRLPSIGEKHDYFWPHARGNPKNYSSTSVVGPFNLQKAFKWSWHHPKGRYETVVLGAVLDDKKNIYLSSMDAIRKFTKDGVLIWGYDPGYPISTCASIEDGLLFGNAEDGHVFALDMENGKPLWNIKKGTNVPGDTGYVEVHDGVVVTGVDSGEGGGATRLLGLDAKTGATLWEYSPPVPFWNVMAQFPGDDSTIHMDLSGVVYKHALHNNSLLWKTESTGPLSFSDGGVIVGPDGTSYSCSNSPSTTGHHGQTGALRAYGLSDGKMLWEQTLEYPCNSWPVVTPKGEVVVPMGEFVDSPAASDQGLRMAFQTPSEFAMQQLSLSLGDDEMKAYHRPRRTGAIKAFNAKTGEPAWRTELPTYGRLAARGDEDGYVIRKAHTPWRDQCLPAQFSAPTVSGDGTIYVGRADGQLYAVEDGTGKFHTFNVGSAFLHPGTIWGPGIMAVPSCDSLHVWTWHKHRHPWG